jgi:hypothetical protein
MFKKLLVCLAVITLLSPAFPGRVAAQEVKLYPVDEAAKDASFKRFRDRLIAALIRRDRKYLLGVLHPRIMNGFGGNRGVKAFVEQWEPASPNSTIWTELLTILSLGGSFIEENGQKSFYAPYVSSRWDTIEGKLPRSLDGDFCCGAVLGIKVGMHSRPDASAPVLAVLSYDVVQVDYGASVDAATGKEPPWVKIKTFKSQDGYIPKEQFRSPTDYRASFKKVRGRWLMEILVAGD